jgi:FkbH-like protein
MRLIKRLRRSARAGYLCAMKLREHQASITSALMAGLSGPRTNHFGEDSEVFEARVKDGLDLLIGHVEGRPGFGALYAGARMFELYRPQRSRSENFEIAKRAVEEDLSILLSYLKPIVRDEELAAFKAAYEAATSGFTKQAIRHVRTLIIGDCLTVEIASFLLGSLLAEGISIDPYPINSRDPAQLKQIIDSLDQKDYDVVFFSPFSHTRLPEIEQLLKPANGLMMSSATRSSLVTSILRQTRVLLDYLSDRFECPIFIHNAALISRSHNQIKVAALSAVTWRLKAYARERIDQWLKDYVAMKNSSSFQHLFVIDELALAQNNGYSIGCYLHDSEFQHATNLSQELAEQYLHRISTISDLLGKKLVICDLDNTIWSGIIGEGPVTHFIERQKVLKRLKDHGGVVLSIASKNDPAKVHFQGGLLSQDDFVAPQISWNQKSNAIKTIKQTLNLQTKHMIFLDDRPDERALVKESFPDILTLDATNPDVWKKLSLWADLVFGSSDLDRTRLYQEQALRDSSIDAPIAPNAPPDGDALKKLGLVITVRSAEKSDLKRIAELINRTNQWNLVGARTSFDQMRRWHASDHAHVLIASVADRFGDMGTVCAAIVTTDSASAEIPVFVLSCRVFGYGVETAVLGEIVRRCELAGKKAIVGRYRATNQNQACHNMYLDHGFERLGDDIFQWTGSKTIRSVPWADVRMEASIQSNRARDLSRSNREPMVRSNE